MTSILAGQPQGNWENKSREEHLVARDDGWSYQRRESSVDGQERTENGPEKKAWGRKGASWKEGE